MVGGVQMCRVVDVRESVRAEPLNSILPSGDGWHPCCSPGCPSHRHHVISSAALSTRPRGMEAEAYLAIYLSLGTVRVCHFVILDQAALRDAHGLPEVAYGGGEGSLGGHLPAGIGAVEQAWGVAAANASIREASEGRGALTARMIGASTVMIIDAGVFEPGCSATHAILLFLLLRLCAAWALASRTHHHPSGSHT